MFGFLKLPSADRDDPLRSPAAASAWLQCLPPEDALARQRRVLAAVRDIRRGNAAIDRERLAAIDFVDTASDADRRRLLAQYVATADRSPAVADALWEAMHELNLGFVAAYRTALAHGGANDARHVPAPPAPLLLARLIRCLGIDSKLQAFRYQRWVPAKWAELHRCYRLAVEHGIERTPLPREAAHVATLSSAPNLTVEQEYLAVLLAHRIDTGNLSPAEFDFIGERLRHGTRDLALTREPRSSGDFAVDIASLTGLLPRSDGAPGPTLRFVDVAPLSAHLRREIAALAEHRAAVPALSDRQRSERIATLHRARRALMPSVAPDLRGAPRERAMSHAIVRLGLAHIHARLTARDDWQEGALPAGGVRTSAAMAATLSDLDAIGRRSGAQDAAGTDMAAAAAAAPTGHDLPASGPRWTIVDRSLTGLRIRGAETTARRLAIGSLLVVDGETQDAPLLCVVCRLSRTPNDTIEAGLSLVAGRVEAVTLHTQCPARHDMHIVVDGVDLSAMGAIFRGLFVPPRAWSGTALHGGSLIIPTGNHDTGRRVVLATGGSVCTVILRQPLERHAEWTWTTFDVVDSTSGRTT